MQPLKFASPRRVTQGVFSALRPRRTLETQNAWNLYGDIAWYGILSGIVGSFLAVFTIRLGGTDTQVGLLSALPALISVFVSIPGARLLERDTRSLSVLIVTAVGHRAGYLLIALLPVLFVTQSAWIVVAITGLQTIPQGVANIAFTDMFARTVPPENRARVVSVRQLLIGVTSTVGAFAAGKLLDWLVFPLNYQVLFTIGFAASMVSAYYLTRIRLPRTTRPGAPHSAAGGLGLRGYWSMLTADTSYSRFTLASFVFQWGLYFSVPLYSIYWVRTLDASEGWIGLINMVGSATTIFFYPLWGRLTARRGNRLAMIITTAGLAGYPFLLAIFPNLQWTLFVSFWGGVFTSGQALSFFNGLLEVCPERGRAAHIAAYTTLASLAAFISPILSTSLTGLFGIPALLFAAAGMRLFGSFLLWQMVGIRPPQEMEALQSAPARND